jgi:hypothetical protein
MAGLVKCRVCGRRISEESAREIKGATCCPPCYQKLTAKLNKKQGTSEPAASAPASPRPRSSRTSASPSEKLARKAMGYKGRGLAPDMPDMPDMPDLPAGFSSAPRGGGAGFRIDPSALGQGIYAALIGAGIYLVYHFGLAKEGEKPDFLGFAAMGLAAFFGLPALLLGLLEAIKGGETRKQISGGVAVAVGALLIFGVGRSFFKQLSEVPKISDQLVRKKPDPKAKPKPKAKPDPKAKPKPKPKPDPKAKPEPKPKPKPKPKPETSRLAAEQLLRRRFMTLLPESALAARKQEPKLHTLSALRKNYLRAVRFEQTGNRAEGTAELRIGNRRRDFKFVAEKQGEDWRVISFGLPEAALKADLGPDGKWKVTEAATRDPAIRYRRSLSGLDPGSFPISAYGRAAVNRYLKPYGTLRDKTGKEKPLADGAKGVLVVLSRKDKVGDLFSAISGKSGYRPAALLVIGRGGPIYPLPRVGAKLPKSRLKAQTIEILPQAPGKPPPGARYKFDIKVAGLLRPTTESGMKLLASRMRSLHQMVSRPGEMPVKIIAVKEAPLALLIEVIDRCQGAGFRITSLWLDPSKAK